MAPGDFTGSSTHIGPASNQFTSGENGFIGFQFTPNDTLETFYGWMRVTLNNTGGTGTIHDWAWENSGNAIQVSSIPEPTSVVLILVGSIFFWRRKSRIGDKAHGRLIA